MYFPTALEAGGPRAGCQHGQVLLKYLLWLADMTMSHCALIYVREVEREIPLPLLLMPQSYQIRAPSL